ncbi:MAG: aspartate aminotransferase family protein [Planctomycetes bacterium]|nr:aspartate aminotransferase family protein [Planctomycetota bacterium]
MQRDTPSAEDLIARRRRHLWPCTHHFYADPPVLVRGSMQYLFDAAGKRYLDLFAGVSVVHCGHCNEEILEATIRQLRTLQHTTTIYLTEPIVELAETLSRLAPGDLDRTMFVNTGSEANEAACLLATLHTRRHEFVALRHGLHGRTKLGISLTGLGMWRADPSPIGGISFLRNPNCLRCPLERETCDLACADELKTLIQTQTSGAPAAFIAEPVQGNGGIVPMPEGYLRKVQDILAQHGALLILDEVQTGIGRTGTLFACEQDDVVPDALTLAKGLGNGTPIGACIAREGVAASFTRPSASTTGGNPVAAATALAVLRYVQEHGLVARSRELGAVLRSGLESIAAERDGIAEVRGRGLMLGMELTRDALEPDADRTDRVLEAMKERGFLLGKSGPGRNVLTFQPPLVIERDDLNRALTALDEVLASEPVTSGGSEA